MLPGGLLVVQFCPHVKLRVGFEVEGCQLSEIIDLLALVLEIVVSEETGVYMLTYVFSDFKEKLVLDHLQSAGGTYFQGDLSSIKVDYYDT